MDQKNDFLLQNKWYFVSLWRDNKYSDKHVFKMIQEIAPTKESLDEELILFEFVNKNTTILKRNITVYENFQKQRELNCNFVGNLSISK